MRSASRCSSRAVAAALFVATGHAAAADTPVTFQLNWMAGGANAGFAAARRGGLLQGRRTRRHARAGQRLRQHRAARRQRPRAACLCRRRRGEPADRQGRADEDRRDDLPVESERGDGAQEDRHQVGEGSRGQEGRRAVGLVADDDAAAAAQVQQPEGIGHQHDQHAGRVDGAGAAAGPGRRHPRVDRRVSDPGARRKARNSTSTVSPTTACRRSARRSSRATTTSRSNPGCREEVHRGEPQGLELRARQSRQGDQGPEEGLSRSEREAGGRRARRDHAAVLQRRREVHRQGRGRAVGRSRRSSCPRSSCCPRGRIPKTYYTNDYLPPASAMRACKS